eukprot:3846706-Karenia_brevis.AAC.1
MAGTASVNATGTASVKGSDTVLVQVQDVRQGGCKAVAQHPGSRHCTAWDLCSLSRGVKSAPASPSHPSASHPLIN